MKYLLLVLFAGCAVKCDDNYFVVEAPEDQTEDHERPFNVYWNVPTMQCKSKKIPFKNLYERYGIHQNKDDSFRGDVVSILYDPGLFPALLKNKTTGTLHFRNGGVPQEGDLELHLKTFKSILDKNIPDPDFNGVGIIDFEWWRPIFRQNMGSLVITKNISIEIQKNLYWEIDQDIHKAARLRFEKAARTFMKTTLAVAKQMRPNALWGYYGFPYCFNMANKNMKETCADKIPEENDRTRWLWSESTALYPSVYSSKELTTSQLVGLIRGRIKEAQRVKRKGTAVLPYFWFRYREGGFLSEEDLKAALETLYKSHASGFIIWGGSEDVNTVAKCKDLLNYVENTLGPAISEYTKAKTKTREDILQTKKKAPHHKLTEITNYPYHENLELHWKPPENCVKDINKYVEEELQIKGYGFNDINEVMTNVNYSIHIKIPFRSLEEKPIMIENKDSSKENSVTSVLKDIQNTPDVPSEETSQMSRKMIILKKLLQIQQLTKEILELEAAETIDLKDAQKYLKADFSTVQDDVKKDNIELTSKPAANSVVSNGTLSTEESTPTGKLEEQTQKIATEYVSYEIVPNATEPSFKTSTENVVAKFSENQASTQYSSTELSQSHENLNETSSGDHLIVKLLEDSEDTTKSPIIEITQTIYVKDVTSQNLNADVTTPQGDLKKENLEFTKSLLSESLDPNDASLSKGNPATETMDKQTYTLPIESVSNGTEPMFKASSEDLEPKLLENQTANLEYSSTQSTQSYDNSNKTANGDNIVTKLIKNYQTTIEIPILEKIHLRNETHKDISIDVAALQNDTKKDTDFALKLLPIENSQLNDIFYYIETSTTESQQTDTTLFDSVSNEIMANDTGSVFKTSTNDLPKVLENQTSSTESKDRYKSSDKQLSGEPFNPKLEENRHVTTETTVSEATQTFDGQDSIKNNLPIEVTTVQDDLKEENVTLALEPLHMEAIQLNNTLYYSIETSNKETQDKMSLEISTENLSKEIITKESKPTFETSIDNIDANILENQTFSAELTQNYENSDKISGENIGSNFLRQNSQNILEISSTEIATEMSSQETLQMYSTKGLMNLLENEEMTTEMPDLLAGEIIDPKNVLQESFNTDVAKEQADLKTEEKDLGFKTMPIEFLELNDTLTTENEPKKITSTETEPLYETIIKYFVPNLLDNQASSVENLTTESINSSENTDKTSRGEYLAVKVLQNDQATTEMPTLDTKDFKNDTQKNFITDFSDLQDELKKKNTEVVLPTQSSQIIDALSRIESFSTEPEDSENEIDVFDTTTLKTLIEDKSDSIELAEQQTDTKIPNEHKQMEIEKVNFTELTKISNISGLVEIDTVENNNKNNSQSTDLFEYGAIVDDKESTEIINIASAVNLTKTEVLKTFLNETDNVNINESTSTEATTTDPN